jgi:nucleotide-binding universal stress UspA family protein
MTAKRRRAYEAGHRAKFLVIVDGTPESDRAIYFAARRAARTGIGIMLLAVVSSGDFQQWLGVGDVMKAEAEEEANRMLDEAAARVRALSGIEPTRAVRFGPKSDEVLTLIEEDEDIALLVLAAGTGSEGPGPLVTMLAGPAAGTFPVPVAIVPGHLADEEIDALA